MQEKLRDCLRQVLKYYFVSLETKLECASKCRSNHDYNLRQTIYFYFSDDCLHKCAVYTNKIQIRYLLTEKCNLLHLGNSFTESRDNSKHSECDLRRIVNFQHL